MPCALEIRSTVPNITVKHYNRVITIMVVKTFNYTKSLSIDHDRDNVDLT